MGKMIPVRGHFMVSPPPVKNHLTVVINAPRPLESYSHRRWVPYPDRTRSDVPHTLPAVIV